MWYAGDTGVFTVSTIMSSPGPTSALIDTAGSVWTRITIQPYVTRSLTISGATVIGEGTTKKIELTNDQ